MKKNRSVRGLHYEVCDVHRSFVPTIGAFSSDLLFVVSIRKIFRLAQDGCILIADIGVRFR